MQRNPRGSRTPNTPFPSSLLLKAFSSWKQQVPFPLIPMFESLEFVFLSKNTFEVVGIIQQR